MMNETSRGVCDPCLVRPFRLHPVVLALPSFLCLPLQSLVFYKQASHRLTDKTDLLTVNVIFVHFLLSFSSAASALSLQFVPVLYIYVWSCLIGLLCIGHPLFQSLLCAERYLAVNHPMTFLKYRPVRYRVAVLAAGWGCTMAGHVFVLIICEVHLFLLTAFLRFGCVFLSALLALNSFTCLSMLRTLVKPSPRDKHNGASKKGGNCIKRKAFGVVLSVQFKVVLCYLPPLVLYFSYGNLTFGVEFCSVYLYNVWFISVTSALQCLMYLHSLNQLKKTCAAFLRIFQMKL